jgi:hypothetical protein
VTLAIVAAAPIDVAAVRPPRRRSAAPRNACARRPGSAPLAAAVDRMLAVLEGWASRRRARRSRRDDRRGGRDHRRGRRTPRRARRAPARRAAGRRVGPLRCSSLGSTGAMGGGQFGTALSAVQTAHHAGRESTRSSPEGRPGLEGARIASWELRQAGVPHASSPTPRRPVHRGGERRRRARRRRTGSPPTATSLAPAGAYPLASPREPPASRSSCARRRRPSTPALATGAAARSRRAGPGRVRVGDASSPRDRVRNRLAGPRPAGSCTAIVTEQGVVAVDASPWRRRRRADVDGDCARRERRWPRSPVGIASRSPRSPGARPIASCCASTWSATGCSRVRDLRPRASASSRGPGGHRDHRRAARRRRASSTAA